MKILFAALLLLGLISIPSQFLAQINPVWDPDYNNDNQIGVADLLALLGVFEDQDMDDDGIWDSQDECIGIFDACGNCNGTALDVDEDGICDDYDDCIGEYDECGVCNGLGPSWSIIDSIIITYDSIFVEPIDSWYVYQLSSDTIFTYTCALAGCTDPDACNFDDSAMIDNGQCDYGSESYDCDGNCLELDLNQDGICDYYSTDSCALVFLSGITTGSCSSPISEEIALLPVVGPDGANVAGSQPDSLGCGACWYNKKTFSSIGVDTIHIHTHQHRFFDSSRVIGQNGNIIWEWQGESEAATWYDRNHSVSVSGNDSISIEFTDGYGVSSFCRGYMRVTGITCSPMN